MPVGKSDGAATTEAERQDAVKRADNKRGSIFMGAPPMVIIRLPFSGFNQAAFA
jgi:hypothetical protein